MATEIAIRVAIQRRSDKRMVHGGIENLPGTLIFRIDGDTRQLVIPFIDSLVTNLVEIPMRKLRT